MYNRYLPFRQKPKNLQLISANHNAVHLRKIPFALRFYVEGLWVRSWWFESHHERLSEQYCR